MTDSQYIAHLQNSLSDASDEAAYKKLFYYFHPPLRRFAYNLLGNAEVAEEIVSDVLLNIWTMRDRIALVKDLKLYLFKAVKNASLNYLKSAVYKNSKLTGTLEDKDELYISPESEYIHSELQQLLLSAISRLPARCQMVFRLVKEYGLSYAQVSAVMDISQNTIETHMKLALKKLKAVLDSYRIAGK